MSGMRRQRQSLEGWRALLRRFTSSGQTVRAFCESEAISPASFYRWRSLLGAAAGRVPVASALPLAPTEFVDLGQLAPPSSSPSPSPSFELHLDLGGGLTLHLVRR
jgi:hypothetical protein